MINKLKRKIILLVIVVLVMNTVNITSFAKEKDDSNGTAGIYYFGESLSSGKDNGYINGIPIDIKDPHYGWKLGDFIVEGYTNYISCEDGSPIFLKNIGDTVKLSFNLKQDINKLNGNENLIINNDENGFNEYFQIQKSDPGFQRGALIVTKTDVNNYTSEPTVYTNYLEADAQTGANTEIDLFEEGDYEVELDYEIKNSPRKIFGKEIFPTYTDYYIYFSFSVRNGDCMVFPLDVKTNSELTNGSFTENGFYLDLAKSKYLDITVKKENLNNGANGLVEDTRFNRPAKDKEKFEDEGIYTITVYNEYTYLETEKKIYVGTDNVMKAYMISGLSLTEIQDLISQGAYIEDDGTIVMPVEEEEVVEELSADNTISDEVVQLGDAPEVISSENESRVIDSDAKENNTQKKTTLWPFIVIALIVCGGAFVFIKRKEILKWKPNQNELNGEEENE